MLTRQWQSLLGLAARARMIISGEEQVIQSIRAKKAFAVIMANDASKRTKKTISNKCNYYDVPLLIVDNREVLGRAIGQPERVLVAVTDQGFGQRMIALLDQSTRG
nr:YlxQ family RNA-binding protein [Terrilactibacillus laevilacticus]